MKGFACNHAFQGDLMARPEPLQRLVPSVLDRLIDLEPEVSREPQWSQSQTVREVMQAVRRDLESLLNTRKSRYLDPDQFPQASRSVVTFGLPDISAVAASSLDDRELLRRAVEQSISQFEPRLTDIRVIVYPPQSESDRNVRMTIDAVLYVAPLKEHITFDTVVQPSSGAYAVMSRD
jgi:type VI secretion system protein ImpF